MPKKPRAWSSLSQVGSTYTQNQSEQYPHRASRLLGVTVADNLSWAPHIQSGPKNYILGLIYRSFGLTGKLCVSPAFTKPWYAQY